jgi:uncharacterized membrane protein
VPRDPVRERHLQRSRIAFGICVICALFLAETVVAHRTTPSPASPFVWALLGSVAGVALVVALWSRARAR